MQLIETICPLCDSDLRHPLFSLAAQPPAPAGPWTFVECERCGSAYLRPRPDDPSSLYDHPDYHVYRRPGIFGRVLLNLAARFEARRVGRLSSQGGRIFEIGCGTGQVLAALARQGFDVSGVEPSAAAARVAAQRGLRVEHASFEQGVGVSGHYDVVFAAHVFEHVVNPRDFLREARRLVRPDGVILLKLPLVGSWDTEVFGGHSGVFDLPYHLFVPSIPGLTEILREQDLRITRITKESVPNDWIHGLRGILHEATDWSFRFIRPSNPLFAATLYPFSLTSWAFGCSGRARVEIRKSAG